MLNTMRLTAAEALYLLNLIAVAKGGGYAEGPVGRLQAKLSIMVEHGQKLGDDLTPLEEQK